MFHLYEIHEICDYLMYEMTSNTKFEMNDAFSTLMSLFIWQQAECTNIHSAMLIFNNGPTDINH